MGRSTRSKGVGGRRNGVSPNLVSDIDYPSLNE